MNVPIEAIDSLGRARRLGYGRSAVSLLAILYLFVLSDMTSAAASDRSPAASVEGLITSADAYVARGMPQQASETLSEALRRSDASTPRDIQALLQDRLGLMLRGQGRFSESLEAFDRGVQAATDIGREDLLAALMNDKGLTYTSQRDYPQAIYAFELSRRYASTAQDDLLFATATINLARARVDGRSGTGIEALLREAGEATGRVADPSARLERLLELGEVHLRAGAVFELADTLRKPAHEALKDALQLAQRIGDERSVAYALGYTGSLYESAGHLEEALELTRQAAFLSQGVRDEEGLYQWEWQVARLLLARDNSPEAIAAYRQALSTLDRIRTQLITNPGTNYAEQVRPLYFEFADVLLRQSASLRDAGSVRRNLLEVRSTLEKSKVAELVDYFNDQCVVSDGDAVELDRLASTAAILYPVLLEDRIEILASLPGGLKQFSVAVSSADLEYEVREFRERLQSYDGTQDYLTHAQRLYGWLIKPLEVELAGERVDTLVIVPDGGLRTIPLAALHDGSHYLIEKYAVATTLGLSLTSARPIPRENVSILASGITESVQGFPALPSVAEELLNISQTFPTTVYKDADFQRSRVENEISQGEYSIVHIATHGVFDSDHSKSFLLAYDDRLTMDSLASTIGLRRYQEDELELLVLSACETAAGDDRAALGLAGVAFRAGARSALATLWFISDESTALLVSDFYRNLRNPDVSKAEALRRAQRALIDSEEFRHPAYWAPFLLIGNWL